MGARTLATALRNRFIGRRTAEDLRRLGMVHGRDLHLGPGAIIDEDFAYLIELGDDVTLAPRVSLIAHDASTKVHTGLTRIAPIRIGSRVFLGAGVIVLPGVTIGDDVIIGAGSVVTRDVPSGHVAVGNPASVVATLTDFIGRREAAREQAHTFARPPHLEPGFGPATAAGLRADLADGGAYCP